ncbi:Conserved_hypothetical protein [Hexamita inflata]|uniref:Uncharacterized protein n=1 Tax=Hexamita inflata TaxID=28002 RepID=A0AA86P0Z9_9EUKA|nr:Conserved hypothetical protein [Hexamita inflata]
MEIRYLQYAEATLVIQENCQLVRYRCQYNAGQQEIKGIYADQTITVNMGDAIQQHVDEPFPHISCAVSARKFQGAKADLRFPNETTLVIIDRAYDKPRPNNVFDKLAGIYGKYVLVLEVPYKCLLEYFIFTQQYQIFNEPFLSKQVIQQTITQNFVELHAQKLHLFFSSNISDRLKLQVFKQLSHLNEFYDYPFVKPFRIMNKVDPTNLKDVCMYITSRFKRNEPFDRPELIQHMKHLIQDANTWIVENTELRGMIGIICAYLAITPFDRLNGDFDNDRIVLYTYFIMSNDLELFEKLIEYRGYIILSILNDMPGFGLYFFNKQCFQSYDSIQQFIALPIRKSISNQKTMQYVDPTEEIQKMQLKFEFKFIEVVFNKVKEWSIAPNFRNIRSVVKLIDALLHSYRIQELYYFVILCTIQWINFIYNQLTEQQNMEIRDCQRCSGAILAIFQEYIAINDPAVVKLLSLFVYAVYQLCQQQIIKKQTFTIKDKTLPLNFEGNQAVFCYMDDQYEFRAVQNLHILAEPGQMQVFSSSNLISMKDSMQTKIANQAVSVASSPRRQRAKSLQQFVHEKSCPFCEESLARVLKKILLLNPKPDSYYFDSCLQKRNCLHCLGQAYFMRDEQEVYQIVNKQPVLSAPIEFSDEKMYKNYITYFINVDNSIEQLRNLYDFKMPINKIVDDIKQHRENVKRLLNVHGSIIYDLNDVSEIVDFLKKDVDTLDFSKVDELIKYKIDVDNLQQYDAFMNPKEYNKAATQKANYQSVENFKKFREQQQKVAMGDSSSNEKFKATQDQYTGIRVYVVESISIESAMVSMLRVWLKGSWNIKAQVQQQVKQQEIDAYTVFYKNEQIFGRPLGLPSQMSIFKNAQPNQRCECHFVDQLQMLLNMQQRCKKQFIYYIKTFDGNSLRKYQAQFSNQLLLQMLSQTLLKFPISYLSQIHATSFYENTICLLIQAVKLNEQNNITNKIVNQLQEAINDYSDEPFTSNWFKDSFKSQRNKGLHELSQQQLDQRVPAWPEQFELNMQQENYTANGLGYVPAFLRFLSKFRSLAFDFDEIQMVKSVFYQFQQFKTKSKVTVVQRYKTTRTSLQSLTVAALLGRQSEILRKMILNRDNTGMMTVKHLSNDTIQMLLNNGELGLMCDWLNETYDDVLKYLNTRKYQAADYQEYVKSLMVQNSTSVQKQNYLKHKLQEYYFNSMVQINVSVDMVFGALSESNSIMIAPVLMKIASIKRNLTGDSLFCQLQARAIIQLKVLLSMELKVRTKNIIESMKFNNRKLIPLVTKVEQVKQIQLQTDVKLLITENLNVEKMNLITTLGYEKMATNIDFTRGMLNYRGINLPVSIGAQMYDSKFNLSNCQVIIDADSLQNKKRRVNCIIADHQMYIYHGKQLDIFVGAISLVGATVCIAVYNKEKFIALTTKFPRLRNYAIYTDDDADELFISILSALMK